mmetsp:Transcript_23436/g.31396  ORF Transcript_23436/g.31396 Transcript_23436/m.31396 type:complete len:122 (-) Transcript_23436:359-724(-)
MFIHRRQEEQGMKQVNRLHYGNVRDFIKAIRADDYEFYDEYPNCKEVLIVGSSNAGKSSLINVLNEQVKIAKTRKKSGKTQSLHFFYCKQTLNVRKGITRQGMLIDSPGYGYTSVPVKVKN